MALCSLAVQLVVLATALATRGDTTCGQFDPNAILHELPAVTIKARVGHCITLQMQGLDHQNYKPQYVLIRPNGDQYSLNKKIMETHEHNGSVINYLNTHPSIAQNDVDVVNVETANTEYSSFIKNNVNVKSLQNVQDIDTSLNRLRRSKERAVKETNEERRNPLVDVKCKQNETNGLVLGPLLEDDYGNWVISSCYIDKKGRNVEIYRVYNIYIEESVATSPPAFASLQLAEDLKISLQETVPHLESCQLVAPRGAFDREYGRDSGRMEYCGFLVKNVEFRDAGIWTIIAVGKIAYIGHLYVSISDKP